MNHSELRRFKRDIFGTACQIEAIVLSDWRDVDPGTLVSKIWKQSGYYISDILVRARGIVVKSYVTEDVVDLEASEVEFQEYITSLVAS